MQVAELVTKFSFTGSLKPLDKLNVGLTSAVKNIGMTALAFTAAGAAIVAFTTQTLKSVDAQMQLAREIGVSIEALQEWGYVASVNGSNAEAMERSIASLSKKIGEAALYGNADFSMLGISIRDSMGHIKSADVILKELADRFKQLGLSLEEQKAILGRLGIDESLLQTLRLGSVEIDKLRQKARALGIVSEQDAKMVTSFNDSLTTLKYGLNAIQKHIAIAFAPGLKDLADKFTNLLIVNKEAIREGLKKFFEIINKGLGVLFDFGKMLLKLIDNTIGLKTALIGLAGAILLLNRNVKRNLIVAFILGIIAVIDDLKVAMEGGKSVINEWLQSWFNTDVPTLIKDIKDSFMDFVNYVGSTTDKIKNFFKPIMDMIDKIESFVSKNLHKLSDIKITHQPLDPIQQKMQQDSLFWKYKNMPKIAPVTIPQNNTSTIQQNNNITIEVKSSDPQIAAKHVRYELQDMLNNANVHFGKGGR